MNQRKMVFLYVLRYHGHQTSSRRTATHSNTHAEPSAFEDDTPQLGIFKPRPSPRSELGSKTASARKASAKPGKPGAAS